MLRMMAAWLVSWANFGKCSLMRMPGTEVWISRRGPPLTWPGFMSNVSVWLGPPFIHRRMQARWRRGSVAVPAASLSSQAALA